MDAGKCTGGQCAREGQAVEEALPALVTSEGPLRIVLELDRGGDPIRGQATGDDTSGSSFVGWVELVAAIEAMRAGENGGN